MSTSHTVTLSEPTYELLKSLKRRNESFDGVIRRVVKSTPEIHALTPAYLKKEYGLTKKESESFLANWEAEHQRAKKAGDYIEVKSCHDLLK